jgi:hypothetical protein
MSCLRSAGRCRHHRPCRATCATWLTRGDHKLHAVAVNRKDIATEQGRFMAPAYILWLPWAIPGAEGARSALALLGHLGRQSCVGVGRGEKFRSGLNAWPAPLWG